MGLSWAPVDFTGAIARTKADTNTSALKVKIRFIFCLLIRMNQILCLAMLLRGVVPQDLIGFLPLVKAKPKLRNWGLLLVLVVRFPNRPRPLCTQAVSSGWFYRLRLFRSQDRLPKAEDEGRRRGGVQLRNLG